jgi:hypothetical protein
MIINSVLFSRDHSFTQKKITKKTLKYNSKYKIMI